jgi:hypothetical protein
VTPMEILALVLGLLLGFAAGWGCAMERARRKLDVLVQEAWDKMKPQRDAFTIDACKDVLTRWVQKGRDDRAKRD